MFNRINHRRRQLTGILSLYLCMMAVVVSPLNAAAPDNVSYNVLYKGQPDTLNLTRHSLRSVGFFVRPWETDHFNAPVSVDLPKTYQGTLTNHPEVSVIAQVSDAGLQEAMVILPDGYSHWMITEAPSQQPAGLAVQYVIEDQAVAEVEDSISTCGVCQDCGEGSDLTHEVRQQSMNSASVFLPDNMTAMASAPMNGPGCGLTLAELAFDVDNPYYLRYGGDIQAIVDRIEWMLLQVSTFYERDLMISYELTGIIIRTTQEDALYGPETSLLGDLATVWNAAVASGDTNYPPFDFAHLMTDRAAPGIAGLAYLGWSCNGKGYAWSVDGPAVIGHEIGHNWTAVHCAEPQKAPFLNDLECGGGGMRVAAANYDRMIASKDYNLSCLDAIGPAVIPLPPYAHDDAVTIEKAQLDSQGTLTVDVLANDHDANCDTFTIGDFDAITTQGGRVTQSGNQLIYTPPADFVGIDTFTYKPLDTTGRSGLGLVTIEVTVPYLKAYWPLNENSGTTAADMTGNGYDGSLQNRDFGTDSIPGQFDGALTFNGDDQYVRINGGNLATPWTVSLWVNRTGSPNSSAALMTGSGVVLKLEQWPNTKKVGFTVPGVADYAFNYTAPIGTWTHITFVGTSSATSLYVNGAFRQTINVSIPAPLNTLSAGGAEAMRGSLDDVRVYSYNLTNSEIQGLHTGGRASSPIPANWDRSVSPDTSLSWSGNPNAVSHNVFWGTDETAVTNATTGSPEYQGSQTTTSFTPVMTAGQTYFWRVDEVLSGQTITGPVWRFNTVQALHADMIAYLPFDFSPLDYSGHSRGASPFGPPELTAGQIGQAYEMIGADGKYLRLDGSGDIPVPWTASMWVKRLVNTSGAAALLDGGASLRLEQWNNTDKVGITRFGVADHVFNYTAPLNNWVNLTFVGTASNTKLYVNGVLTDTLNVSISLPFRRVGNTGSDKLNAVVDEIAAWNRNLTPTEIQTVYTTGQNGQRLLYPNNAPSFDSDPFSKSDALEDAAYIGQSLSDDASDADVSDTLTFSKVSGPDWLEVAANGDLSGTPDDSHVGVNSFTVQVSDGMETDTATLDIFIQNLYDGQWGLLDFAGFSSQWKTSNCGLCGGADLDGDHDVDINDLLLFTNGWLTGGLNDGLVGYWALGESGGITAADDGPKERAGTLVNMDSSDWVSGWMGNALDLDGVDDYVQVAGYKGIAGNQSRTCSAWIKTTKTETEEIMSWGSLETGGKWSVGVKNNVFSIRVKGGNIYGTTVVNDGHWHHVTVTWKPGSDSMLSNARLYVDGNEEEISNLVDIEISTDADQDLLFGSFKETNHFQGLIDEVRIYDRALSEQEIVELFN